MFCQKSGIIFAPALRVRGPAEHFVRSSVKRCQNMQWIIIQRSRAGDGENTYRASRSWCGQAMDAEDALSCGRDFSFALVIAPRRRAAKTDGCGSAGFLLGLARGSMLGPTLQRTHKPHTPRSLTSSKVARRPASQPTTTTQPRNSTPSALTSSKTTHNGSSALQRKGYLGFGPPLLAHSPELVRFSRNPHGFACAREREREGGGGEGEADAFVDVAGSRPPPSRSPRRSAVLRARARLPRRSALSCATRTESPRSRPSPVRLCRHRERISRELTRRGTGNKILRILKSAGSYPSSSSTTYYPPTITRRVVKRASVCRAKTLSDSTMPLLWFPQN